AKAGSARSTSCAIRTSSSGSPALYPCGGKARGVMFLLYLIASLLLAALLVYAGVRKLSHDPDVVASYARVGVPEARLDLLAAVLFAGAAGVLAGIIV